MRMSITKFVPGLVAHNLPVEPYVDDYRSTNHESVISLPHSDRGSLSTYLPALPKAAGANDQPLLADELRLAANRNEHFRSARTE